MTWVRSIFCALAFICIASTALAQYGDGHIRTGDSVKIDKFDRGGAIDSTGITTDSLANDTLDTDSTFFQQIDSAEDEAVEPDTFFKVRGGFYGGATADLTSLDPHSLDPVLDGDLVMYGAQGYVILNSWMFGAGGAGATLYGLSPLYDRFNFGYAGFLTGYDTRIFHGGVTLQGSLLIGGGSIEMLRKRADIIDSTGHDILERYRQEGFFLLRPGISIGFTPIQYVEISAGVDYLLPVGGSTVGDLRAFTYGLRLTFGLGD